MGGLLLCIEHGKQAPVGASDRLVLALKNGLAIPADWVSLVIVQSGDRATWHLVDSERVAATGLDPAQSPFVLQDRDYAQRKLNDRLLIVRVIPSDLKNPRVCRQCLASAVEPQGTERLRLPTQFAKATLIKVTPGTQPAIHRP